MTELSELARLQIEESLALTKAEKLGKSPFPAVDFLAEFVRIHGRNFRARMGVNAVTRIALGAIALWGFFDAYQAKQEVDQQINNTILAIYRPVPLELQMRPPISAEEIDERMKKDLRIEYLSKTIKNTSGFNSRFNGDMGLSFAMVCLIAANIWRPFEKNKE